MLVCTWLVHRYEIVSPSCARKFQLHWLDSKLSTQHCLRHHQTEGCPVSPLFWSEEFNYEVCSALAHGTGIVSRGDSQTFSGLYVSLRVEFQKLNRSSRPPHHCVASMLNETGRSFASERASISRTCSKSSVAFPPCSTENWSDIHRRLRPSALLVTPLKFAIVDVIAACEFLLPPMPFRPVQLAS